MARVRGVRREPASRGSSFRLSRTRHGPEARLGAMGAHCGLGMPKRSMTALAVMAAPVVEPGKIGARRAGST